MRGTGALEVGKGGRGESKGEEKQRESKEEG